MPTAVIISQDGPVARVRFEAPNGIHILSAETRQAISTGIARLDADSGCRIIIFEAQGRTFLAGAELTELQNLTAETATAYSKSGQQLMNAIAALRPVTICAIQAACVGGGCELSLACDFRIAAASARIGLPETSLGVIPGWGGTVRSTMLLGAPAARRIILTADQLSADAALQVGLVDQVLPDDKFTEGVDQLAQRLLSRSPEGIKRAKRLIAQFSKAGMKKALAREARQFAACYASGEPAEGIAAFLGKRPPMWGLPQGEISPPPAEATARTKSKARQKPIAADQTVTPEVAEKPAKSKRKKPSAE